jgi:hypothetical protein
VTFDWKAIDAAVVAASKESSEDLAPRVSSLIRLKDSEIRALFPTPADVQKLAKLMDIVSSAAAENDKVNALVADIRTLAPAVLRLLERLA